MAFKQEQTIDPLDIDRYLELDQNIYPSPSASSSSSTHRGKSLATPEFQVPMPASSYLHPRLNSQPTLSGPKHQYGDFQQQTGLPPGALASTLLTQPTPYQYNAFSQQYRNDSANDYLGLKSENIFDFNTVPSHTPSFAGTTDMDMDFDSPVDFFASYVDPNAIGGQEDFSPNNTPVQAPVRLWPGMHQQQANAKAQAQAQEQQQRPQQQKSQPQHPPQQKPQFATPELPRQAKQPVSRPAGTAKPTDPVVEERISRLLNQMRQNIVPSHDDSRAAQPSTVQHPSRPKKDEEEMDEDERLLASEEGKKLSSKERRQLRNKVSARAFRSRRKEYIGQLEGELAIKVSEAEDLHTENEALKAENQRLTDLTRMLLSSPAFSTFLNELSADPSSIPSTAPATIQSQPSLQQTQPTHQQPKPLPQRKDINPNDVLAQQSISNATVEMTLLPDTVMDFSVLDSLNSSWGTGLDYGFDTQVFAVTSLPEGPLVDGPDMDAISGKCTSLTPSISRYQESKNVPSIERMPTLAEDEETIEATETEEETPLGDDSSSPAFELFADSPATSPSSSASEYSLFGPIESEKAFARMELIVDGENYDANGVVSAATMARFESLCATLDTLSLSIEAVTGHL